MITDSDPWDSSFWETEFIIYHLSPTKPEVATAASEMQPPRERIHHEVICDKTIQVNQGMHLVSGVTQPMLPTFI